MHAIGGKVGSAIFVKEIDDVGKDISYNEGGYYSVMNTATAANTVYQPLSFAPEKVRCVIIARFEIEK
jgi:hypothetical protein